MLRRLLPFLLLAIAAAAQAADPTFAIPEKERAALVALFEATGGPQWKEQGGWNGPAGTECEWFRVLCTVRNDGQLHVAALLLENNHLVGRLPAALADLPELDLLNVFGNRLERPLPAAVLQRYDDGSLEIHGYAEQFSAIVGIELTSKPSAVLCGDYEITLKIDGPDTLRRKRCRKANDDDRATFWETDTRSYGSFDFDHLVRAFETSGFADLRPSYERSVTHGTTETITLLYRDGTRRSVEDYARAAPAPFWQLKLLIAGVAFDGQWQTHTRTKPVKE
ncbi:MAG: hypothetical protein JOZ54_11645 [Acidobacteria bacterium]|nr:hypothetical protein [Acidobacteriota bacterium]